eukprot:TRINITY_DN15180_c0_g1_i1.p1 TRINITY_DN15180_c0_g1~~TRINITY_DN15180_c0_g1_i1.p1  ORF type:complete len:457 (+),score=77.24 TRINITY_DN15180_c0_g1_i1:1-1371(+)
MATRRDDALSQKQWIDVPQFLLIVSCIALGCFLFNWNGEPSNLVDICGVKGGDGMSCMRVLKWAGIDADPDWQLRYLIEEYVQLHHRIMDPNDTIPKRYVLIDDEPEAGLGNKFQFMVSTFLFAILSKRALLIDWPEVKGFLHWNGEETVGTPSMSDLLQNPGFDWDFAQHAEHLPYHCHHREIAKDETSQICCLVSSLNETLCRTENLFHGVEEMFQCQDFESSPEPLIRMRGWDYFVPNMALNPFYRDRLTRIFKHGDIFRPLARFLIRPLPSIQHQIDKFIADQFGDHTIGLQIREIGINKLNVTQERLFWEAALVSMQERMLQSKTTNIRFKWFLATDTVSLRNTSFSLFPNWITFRDVRIARDDPQSVIDGFIDLWLLASCDDLVVSAASTYGKVAAGLMGKTSKFVNRLDTWGQNPDWQPGFFGFRPRHCIDPSTLPLEIKFQITDFNNH